MREYTRRKRRYSMLQVEKIVKGTFLPEISSRRQRLGALGAVSVVQSGITLLLFSVFSPLYALGLAVAIPAHASGSLSLSTTVALSKAFISVQSHPDPDGALHAPRSGIYDQPINSH